MLGDSIVQLWPDPLLRRALSTASVLNLGVGSDRVQNTLWRLRSGRFDHVRADRVVVLLGTNNIGSDSACSILAGYRLLIREIDRVFRPAGIVVIEILHRDSRPDTLEGNRLAANDLLRTLATAGGHVRVVALDAGGADFFQEDGLHPGASGYAALSEQLRTRLPDATPR